ncbi:uracil-DNA glycosylase [Candidatus Dependentiae bacterium]|nr:uracil-DNA glycosylase [Candidatus Dependentiae bacterium]
MDKKIESYLSFLAKQPEGTVYEEKPTSQTTPSKKSQTKQQLLDELKKQYSECSRCPLATQGRTNIVFGHGNPNAQVMFIGEGPGRDEDMQSLPFVGRAGKLLTKIIEAMGLRREEIYISNVVKCRPPHNRAPLPDESKTCKSIILYKEIKIIKPKIICTLGATATQELLERPISISKIRGTFVDFNGIQLLPTFHPAYLLRNPTKKRDAWEDMKKIIDKLASRKKPPAPQKNKRFK